MDGYQNRTLVMLGNNVDKSALDDMLIPFSRRRLLRLAWRNTRGPTNKHLGSNHQTRGERTKMITSDFVMSCHCA